MKGQHKTDRKKDTDATKAAGATPALLDAIKATAAALDAAGLERTQIAKYHNTKGGHGFAAEDANNIADRLRGKNAKIVGGGNERSGADRLVDGVFVQSKYYQDASSTMQAAFDPDGAGYRYPGQVLEVPKDQYEECVALMRQRISDGQVPGYNNPADAEELVKQGTVTYKQARNIARAGNIDSVKFDVKTGAALASGAFGLSFAINYWQATRQGMDQTEALKEALRQAFSAGAATLVTHVLTAQLLRTKAAAVGTVAARQGVRAIARTSIGKKAIEGIAAASLGKTVYGAAAVNHVSKVFRSNVVTGAVTTAVTCAPDFYRAAFDNSISWKQCIKNTAVNVVGVAGGSVGVWGGAAAGAAIGSAIPGVGTVVGGCVGATICGIGGHMAANSGAKSLADKLVDDDSKALIATLEREMVALAVEYLLSEQELKQVIKDVGERLDGGWWRYMYRETEGRKKRGRRFVRREFEGVFKEVAAHRLRIAPPSAAHFRRETDAFASNLANGSEGGSPDR